MDIKNYKKGDLIIQEGSVGQEMFFISKGKVNVFKMIDEEKVDLAALGVDEFFGEMSLVLEDPPCRFCRSHGRYRDKRLQQGYFY